MWVCVCVWLCPCLCAIMRRARWECQSMSQAPTHSLTHSFIHFVGMSCLTLTLYRDTLARTDLWLIRWLSVGAHRLTHAHYTWMPVPPLPSW